MRTPDEAGDRPPPPRRDELDESSEGSFPASDAPGWAPLHVGAPGEHPDHRPPAEADRREPERGE